MTPYPARINCVQRRHKCPLRILSLGRPPISISSNNIGSNARCTPLAGEFTFYGEGMEFASNRRVLQRISVDSTFLREIELYSAIAVTCFSEAGVVVYVGF